MKISVATNFDEKLIDGIKSTEVTNLFGKLTNDFVGGGLETANLNSIDRERVLSHVKYAHQNGLTFNYTFNNPFLSNDEFTKKGKNELKELLDWLNEIEVDSLTISIPIFLQYVKKNYPKIDVKISSSVCVNSVSKIRSWEEMGADCIVLDPMTVNREFQLLKDLRDSTSMDLELIVNNNCLYECPMLPYHQAFLGQSSRETGKEVGKDYCYLGCSRKRVLDPANYLISDIIRPEDLHYYEALGYDQFKIIDRATPTDLLIKRCQAYSNRKYDGNLLDLTQHFGYKDVSNPASFLKNVYIDNTKLNKHIDRFIKGKCNRLECGQKCTHCHSFAKRATNMDSNFREQHLSKINQETTLIEQLVEE